MKDGALFKLLVREKLELIEVEYGRYDIKLAERLAEEEMGFDNDKGLNRGEAHAKY